MKKLAGALCAFALLLALCGAREKTDLLILNVDEQALYHYENEQLIESYPCCAKISAEEMGTWRFAGCEGQELLMENGTAVYVATLLTEDAQTLRETVKEGAILLVERYAASAWTEGSFFE